MAKMEDTVELHDVKLPYHYSLWRLKISVQLSRNFIPLLTSRPGTDYFPLNCNQKLFKNNFIVQTKTFPVDNSFISSQ